MSAPAASGPRQALPEYGRDQLARLEPARLCDSVVLCAPEPWALVRDRLPAAPRATLVPGSMERAALEAQLAELPAAGTVIGIGGGSACDAAKLLAWQRGIPLLLVPSILSVDAPFTRAVGVRVDGRVRYIGDVLPEHLWIDLDLLAQAPPALNRGGIGDVLSIATALWDWRLARDERGEAYDAEAAAASQALLDRLIAGAAAIRACREEGLRLLAELFVGEVALCEQVGSSRPEEGSEHYLAYCLEWRTRRAYLHGELIGLCVLLTARHQGQDIAPVRAFLDAAGVDPSLESVGVTADEVVDALTTLPGYLAEETQLPFGVYHHRPLDAAGARALLDEVLGTG